MRKALTYFGIILFISAAAVNAQPTLIGIALDPNSGQMHITSSDGSTQSIKPLPDEVWYDDAQLSPDNLTAAWTVKCKLETVSTAQITTYTKRR
jgi:hypothetical protein